MSVRERERDFLIFSAAGPGAPSTDRAASPPVTVPLAAPAAAPVARATGTRKCACFVLPN